MMWYDITWRRINVAKVKKIGVECGTKCDFITGVPRPKYYLIFIYYLDCVIEVEINVITSQIFGRADHACYTTSIRSWFVLNL